MSSTMPPPPPKLRTVWVTWFNQETKHFLTDSYEDADIAILTPAEGVVLFSLMYNQLSGNPMQKVLRMEDVIGWAIESVDKEDTMES